MNNPKYSSRCDHETKEREAIFKQLLEIDANKSQKTTKMSDKMSDKLTDKLSAELRHLLVEKDDFAERLCSMGSTSHAEANHARIINRGFHTKGKILLFDFLTFFDLI